MPAVSDTEGVIMSHGTKRFSDVAKGYTRFREQDVIFAKITPCMENGKIAVAIGLHGGFACGSTEFHVLRSSAAVHPAYLWRFLRQAAFREEAERHMTGAVGQRRVPAQYIKDAVIPLPPVEEQDRIVSRLDELLDHSKSARDGLASIPRLVERYKQAILAAAFRGELTADWRRKSCTNPKGSPATELAAIRSACFRKRGIKEKPALPPSWTPDLDLPASWEFVSVDQMTTLVQYGSSAKTSESTKGVPVLRMGNIFDGRLDYTNLKYLPASHDEFPELLLREGDILFNRTNSAELVGKTAVYSDRGHPISFASYLIRVRVVGYLPGLLSAYINSALGREWVRSVVNQQVGQANVNGTKLRELGVPFMPVDEQKQLWSLINRAFTSIDHLSKEATRANELLDRLDEATLAKAFRGELRRKHAQEAS
jgi:type I restriction enzyme S subunit